MHFQHVFDRVFGLESTIAGVVFGLVIIGMLAAFAESRRRRRRGLAASRAAERNGLEMAYLTVLTGVVVFLIVTSLSATNSFFTSSPPALTVRVTAYQWCWRFQYPGQPVSIGGQCEGGPLPVMCSRPAGRSGSSSRRPT